jgi:hypothetical protein
VASNFHCARLIRSMIYCRFKCSFVVYNFSPFVNSRSSASPAPYVSKCKKRAERSWKQLLHFYTK